MKARAIARHFSRNSDPRGIVSRKTRYFRRKLLALAIVFLTGCTSYRVVPLGPGVAENNIITPFYGVTRNHVLIPEYTLDEYGNYPTTEEEAEKRFQAQRAKVDPVVKEKYELPASFPNQIPQFFLGLGFVLVSPIAIPVQWLGEIFSESSKKRPFSKVAGDYYTFSFSPPGYEKPRIRERVDYFY